MAEENILATVPPPAAYTPPAVPTIGTNLDQPTVVSPALPPAPAPASAPATSSGAPPVSLAPLIGDDLNFRENWREALPEDIRADPSLETMQNLGSLAKSYVSGQKMIGLDKVAIPNENSSDDVWNTFYNKLGRPDTAETYDFNGVAVAEDLKPSDEQIGAAKTAMHGLGLNEKQAQGMYDYYNKHIASQLEINEQGLQKEHDDSVTALKSEYGYAFPSKIEKANRAMRTFDPDGVIEKLGLANEPSLVKMMVNIGEAISEDKLVGNEATQAITPNEAQTQINKHMANPAYYNKEHPEHATVVHEIQRLMKYKFPEAEMIGSKSIDPVTGKLI